MWSQTQGKWWSVCVGLAMRVSEVLLAMSDYSSTPSSHDVSQRSLRSAFDLSVVNSTTTAMTTTVSSAAKGEEDTGTLVLLFLFFGLAVGILVMQVFSKVGEAIPYTCAIFIMGLVFSATASHHGDFGRSVMEWVNIDADLMVYIFLPPLVFAEAMNLNWYHWKRGLGQAIILAGPGVLLGALFMGIITKYILPYEWSWNLTMVFGSILAATDTVAVVSLLKRVGAAPTLTNVIVGESLLNDGTAMVLFTIFYNSINGQDYTSGEIVSFFLSAIVGSVCLGIVVGLITVRWLRTANRALKDIDILTQIAITLCCAYLVFFLAEYVLEISGVLACVSAGAMLAWLAPPIILNHETMHNVWAMIEWSLNTLIFLIAGLIIGYRALRDVHAFDWIYLLILYAVLMGVRALTIGLLFPFFSRIGHKCSQAGACFMSWSGLRGALGMSLALLVEKNCPEDLKSETSRLFFFVGGIAALTLIINASTAKSLLFYLGLIGTDSAEKQLVTDQIKKKLRRKMDKVITQMTKEFAFTENDLEEVRMSCTLLNDMNMDGLYRDTEVDMAWSAADAAAAATTTTKSIPLGQGYSSAAAVRPVGATVPVPSADSSSSNPYHSTQRALSSRAVMIGDIDSVGHWEEGEHDGVRVDEEEEEMEDAAGQSILGIEDDEDGTTTTGTSAGVRRPRVHSTTVGRRQRQSSESSLRFPRDFRHSMRSHSGVDRSGGMAATAGARGGTALSSQTLSSPSGRPHSSSFTNSQRIHQLLFASHQQAKSLHISHMSRMLSIGHRGSHPVLVQELLLYVRAVFLEIVRVKYWHFIEVGKLPRQSFSAQYLLYSIEVGLDEVTHLSGGRDWTCLEEEMGGSPFVLRILQRAQQWFPQWHSLKNIAVRWKAKHEKRVVYMLTSFIEAHEHAQKKIHAFLGLDEEDDEDMQSPEEIKVIHESQLAVTAARRRLQALNEDTVAAIRSKQAARLVLSKEAEMVKAMVQEGLLSPSHAEDFLEEIGQDTERIERDRHRMYRQGRKSDEERRSSILSWMGLSWPMQSLNFNNNDNDTTTTTLQHEKDVRESLLQHE